MCIVSDVHISIGVHEGMLLPLSHFFPTKTPCALFVSLKQHLDFPGPYQNCFLVIVDIDVPLLEKYKQHAPNTTQKTC